MPAFISSALISITVSSNFLCLYVLVFIVGSYSVTVHTTSEIPVIAIKIGIILDIGEKREYIKSNSFNAKSSEIYKSIILTIARTGCFLSLIFNILKVYCEVEKHKSATSLHIY